MDSGFRRLWEQLMNRALVGVLLAMPLVILASCAQQRDVAEQRAPRAPVEISTKSGVKMVLVPGGEFMMGSSGGNADESPRHKVAVSPFAMDKFEVTQAQFAALEIPDPSQFKSPDRPVEQIRWLNAAEYCNERSRAEGLEPCYDQVTFECNFQASGYRLPTEAEWEYAARAGSAADYPFGSSPQHLKIHACYAGNSKKKTDPVGRKKSNAWGLHDMLGNVAEWCHDVYRETYYQESPLQDPRGPAEGTRRVMRGGSWKSSEAACRVSLRQGCAAGFTDACFTGNTLGFRCVRRPAAEELARLQPAEPVGGKSNRAISTGGAATTAAHSRQRH